MEALQGAEADKAEFLKEAAEIDFVKAATGANTTAKIAAAVTAADDDVATEVNIALTGTPYVVATTSDAVKAALISDAKTELANKLETAQNNTATAQKDVDAVAGLKAAVELYNARVEAQKDTADALTTAEAAITAAQAGSGVSNGITTLTGTLGTNSVTAIDITIGGSSKTVTKEVNGQLVIADGITASDYVGLEDLLSAANAYNAAFDADKAAQTAIGNALVAIGYLDFTIGGKDTLATAVDGVKYPTGGAAGYGDKLTQADVNLKLSELLGLAEEDGVLTIVNGVITLVDGVAVGSTSGTNDASQAYNTLQSDVSNYENSVSITAGGVTATKVAELVAKQGLEKTAQENIQKLTDALAKLDAANEVDGDLKGHDEAIKAAKDAFEALEVEAPVSVDGSVVGTAENDVFLFADKAGTIVNFNAQGEDLLFVGNKFSLQTLTAEQTINQRVGDAAEWEIFAKQNGANVDLYVEQQTFAGNGINETDIVKITLSGVNVADLQLEDGFISIA